MAVRTGEATYVTEEWLERFLSTHEKRPVTVISFKVGRGCAENEGFLSALHACSVDACLAIESNADAGDAVVDEKKYELILKSLAANPERRQFMLDSGWHQAEVRFYACYVPLFEDFVKNNAKGSFSLPLPECFGSTFSLMKPESELVLGKEDVIVMQNMKRDTKAWFQISLEEGLSKDALKLAFRSLAKLHAVPLAMRVKAGAKSVADVIPGWEGSRVDAEILTEHFSDGFRDLEAFLLKKRPSWQPGEDWQNMKDMVHISLSNRSTMRLETVCHADVWNGNLMFSRDELGNLEDCLVIDWQLFGASTPALDVCDALQFCTRYVSDEECEKTLRIYWDELSAALGNFGVNLENDLDYSWSDFVHDLPVAVSSAAINWVCSMEMMFAHGCDEMDERVLSWYDHFSSKDWKTILGSWTHST